METEEKAHELARQIGQAMLKADRVSGLLDMRLMEIAPGNATVSMVVRDDMLNGVGICHGGITFTLADTAFAYACNSRGRKTVALACSINFVDRAEVGDILTARAEELTRSGRTGVYDIAVRKQDGALIAQFRGTSYSTSTSVL
jgi:acyl-CoA thioesterase